MTVAEAAEKWGVSVRRVQRLVSAGRVAGVKKYGRAWMIPNDAEKPKDFRKENRKNMAEDEESSEAEFSETVSDWKVPMPLMNSAFIPGTCKESIAYFKNPDVRAIAQAEYYYFSGKPEFIEKMVEPYLNSPNFSIRISAILLLAYSSMLLGRTHVGLYAMENLARNMEDEVKENQEIETKAFRVLFSKLAKVYLGYPSETLPSLFEYIKYLPAGFQTFACYLIARNAYKEGDYTKSLGIAETALAMQKEVCVIPTIYLKSMIAVNLIVLKRPEEAKMHFMRVMEMVRPDGMYEVLGELHELFHGLVESCLKYNYIEEYKNIVKIASDFKAGWRQVNFQGKFENGVQYLNNTEFSIALLANRRWTNAEIASYMHLSEHTVKRYMSEIYQKLGISSRRQLHQFLLD